jgi:hypothetical protein
LHGLVLVAILMLVSDPAAASALSENHSQKSEQQRLAFKASLGELLLRQLLSLYSDDQFAPSLLSLFHMIAPYASSFSLESAAMAMDFFEKVLAKHSDLVPLVLEGLAAMIQQDGDRRNYFLVAIIQHSHWFGTIRGRGDRAVAALKIVQKFIKKGKAKIKATNEHKLTGLELLTIVQTVRNGNVGRIVISKHPPVFGGELEQTWKAWTNVLFAGCAGDEMRSFAAFEAEYSAKLVEALTKINI